MTGKKIFLLLTALLLNVACFIGVIYASAYLTDSDSKVNSMTPGNSRIKIHEDFTNRENLTPGSSVTKKVSVENTGLNPCYVRMLVLFSDSETARYARMTFNTENWSLADDGYWYYQKILMPGQTTDNIISNVEILANAPPAGLKGFEVIVYGESINSESGGFK